MSNRGLRAGLLVAAVLLGAIAAAIWLLSEPHGHGLTTGDRRAILWLAAVGSVCGLAALVRRPRG